MKNLFKALANFQQEVPVIHKDTSGYGYTYADLPQIFSVINPLLKKHGLAFTQPINGNEIKTILFHVESGENLESIISIPQGVALAKMNDFQVLGSAITYLRRYAISSILGLVTDKDNDATGTQVKAEITPNVTKNTDTALWFNDKQLEDVKKALSDGREVTLNDVKKKYKVSKEMQTKLSELQVV